MYNKSEFLRRLCTQSDEQNKLFKSNNEIQNGPHNGHNAVCCASVHITIHTPPQNHN